MIGHGEIFLVVCVALVVFGASRFPSIMRNLASGIKAFRDEMKKSSPAARPPKPRAKTKAKSEKSKKKSGK